MASFRERVESDDLFFDCAIVSHGYAPSARDYDVVIDVPAALPKGVPVGDTVGSYVSGRHRYRFTHCVEAVATTAVPDETWRTSWEDVLTDYQAWEAAGHPPGFVWGVNWTEAYPGLSYVPDSARAARWSERLGREMHEVIIETSTFVLRLVCHDLRVEQIAVGDPITRELGPLP